MTTRIKLPGVVGGSYQHDTLPFDAQRTINMFTENAGKGSKSRAIMRRFPGLKNAFTVSAGNGPIRGQYVTSGDRWFLVRENTLYEYDTDFTETNRGTIDTISGNVSKTDNGTQMAIADGTAIYSYTLSSNALGKVTSANAPSSTPVIVFIDGYVFGFDPGGAIGTFRHSNLNDVTTWDAADVYTAEGSPDALVTLGVNNRKLWVFGSKSFEVWYNRGGDNVTAPTWERVQGTFKNIGCGAQFSVSSIRGQIFWLGASKDGEHIIWMSGDGYQPIQISTKAKETKMAAMTTVSDATSFTVEYQGHFFYVLTFPTGNETFVYNITENEWQDWNYRNVTTGEQERQRAVNHVFFNRKSYVGDYENGKVYELSKTTYTDDGNPITWERYFPHFHDSQVHLIWWSLQLDILTGSSESLETVTQLSGTATIDEGTSLTGVGSSFTTELVVGDTIVWMDDDGVRQQNTIATITSDTVATISTDPGSVANGVAYYKLEDFDPNIQIRWSDDGGYTFGNWVQMSVGKTGKYRTQVIVRQMGMSKDRVYHVRSSEAIPISIQDNAIAEIERTAW